MTLPYKSFMFFMVKSRTCLVTTKGMKIMQKRKALSAYASQCQGSLQALRVLHDEEPVRFGRMFHSRNVVDTSSLSVSCKQNCETRHLRQALRHTASPSPQRMRTPASRELLASSVSETSLSMSSRMPAPEYPVPKAEASKARSFSSGGQAQYTRGTEFNALTIRSVNSREERC